MITGKVVSLQMRVGVVFRLPTQQSVEIEFVVDTGFEGALTLPVEAIAALGLPFFEETSAKLADNTNVRVNLHAATILWEERELLVAVLAMGQRPLLGTALLDGFNLNTDFADNGSVVLRRL